MVGQWYSSWEPKAFNELPWVDETVTITKKKFGRIVFKNQRNNEGYSFTCVGKVYNTGNCKFLYGYWFSNSTEDDKQGRFLLTINSAGYMMGNFFGPNTQGVMMTGGWILGRNPYLIESAKLLYGKGYHSEKDLQTLIEIKKQLYSKHNQTS
ncbi:hypothetical protein EXU57_09030 [Segetibacter sp. 3557_3]|uniref:hypothetical protein n=1 Tax=Segetibacter sp. 3557_3 TaxID=2547429 RepID=UPI001058F82C|nr:hypothetical protein [Segetibacter sp. 3557_3]TDH26938.1 hypothetical protein EXU57_09030 [Segetibacter sp. 3557_3]